MEEYIGLDVSMKETAVSIRRAGERIWRGKCASDPSIIAELIRKRAPAVKRVVFETGPLSIWFYHSLRAEGLPAICIDARHAKAALDMAANKTDANDADGLAQLAEVGFFREVRVKGFDSMLIRTLVAARTRLVRITTELSNQIRGVMKTFGLVVPAGKGSTFEKNVRSLLADQDGLASIKSGRRRPSLASISRKPRPMGTEGGAASCRKSTKEGTDENAQRLRFTNEAGGVVAFSDLAHWRGWMQSYRLAS
jgi:transposase